MTFKYFFGLFFAIFALSSMIFALDLVMPGTIKDQTLVLYPGINSTVGFLKVEAGTQVFVDSVDCQGISCGTLKASGPYYVFDVFSNNSKDGKITINYHLKGQEGTKRNVLFVKNTADSLNALVIAPNEAKLFESTEVTVVLVNNSDLKLNGRLTSNFPDDVFVPVDFSLDPKTRKEYKTQFIPRNPGYYDLSYYVNVAGLGDEKVGQHTVNITRELKDFLSIPTKSYFPTNPVLSIYSSIVYFISLLA
jgi:hypothetical protein